MDPEVTMSWIQALTSYGALGICCAYFMAKDWVRGKKTDDVIDKNTQAISEFTVALKTMIGKGAV
jgi:hypothetical protein